MLLGQIVAISFASNLFFLAILVHERVTSGGDSAQEETKGNEQDTDDTSDPPDVPIASAAFWYDPIVTLTAGLAINIPRKFGQPRFMMLLLAPHVLAFAPVILNKILVKAAPYGILEKPSRATRISSMGAVLAFATMAVVDEGGSWTNVVDTLHEHPAVSSVGWDVICCWISYTAWFLLGES